MAEELYRKSSLEKLVSPDSLDEYIKVERPHTWISLAAVFLIIAALAVWLGASQIKTTVDVKGVAYDGKIYAYMPPEQADKVAEGMNAEVKNRRIGEVTKIAAEPVSRDEIDEPFISEYFRKTQLEDWNVALTIEAEEALKDGSEISLQIVTEELNPLGFLTQ